MDPNIHFYIILCLEQHYKHYYHHHHQDLHNGKTVSKKQHLKKPSKRKHGQQASKHHYGGLINKIAKNQPRKKTLPKNFMSLERQPEKNVNKKRRKIQ